MNLLGGTVRSIFFVLALLSFSSNAQAVCRPPVQGQKSALDYATFDAQGNLVGAGTGTNVTTTASRTHGTASGQGTGTFVLVDGTSGTLFWTFSITDFSMSTCSATFSLSIDGNLFHSGTMVFSANGNESNYVGVFADTSRSSWATLIRSRSHVQ